MTLRNSESAPGPLVIDGFRHDAVSRAVSFLQKSRLVAFPTETVYGLGGDARNKQAVRSIYRVKDRPAENPLIIHVPDLEHALRLAVFSKRASALAEQFWPGGLTLVLNTRPGHSLKAPTPEETVALRVPDHPLALCLLREAEMPLAAPSANLSGALSPVSAEHVAAAFKDRDEPALILDGGLCSVGVESSVLDLRLNTPQLLRPGAVPAEQIEDALRLSIRTSEDTTAPYRPSMFHSPGTGENPHYAPTAPLRMNADAAEEGEVLLGFGPRNQGDCSLSPAGNLREAAQNLFRLLHQIDRSNPAGIAVAPIPDHGLGAAINDRLRRAAESGARRLK